jgi:Ca2+/H+ antiporter
MWFWAVLALVMGVLFLVVGLACLYFSFHRKSDQRHKSDIVAVMLLMVAMLWLMVEMIISISINYNRPQQSQPVTIENPLPE